MSEYVTSLIREEQIEETKALMSRCFDAKYASIFYLHPESTLIVTHQGQVVAGINLDIYQVNKRVRMGYIGWLYTDENHRGNALAGKLLTEAISFLKGKGCTSLSACVEGDNPASFKQLAKEGFSILGLWQQLKLFKAGTVKVYHHASRFFDMGYFLWHKSLTEESFPEAREDLQALFTTLAAHTLLFFFCLKGWNLLTLVGLNPILPLFSTASTSQEGLMLATPSLFLLARTMAMFLMAKATGKKDRRELVYRGWDTAWITALALTLTVGFPFPAAGNLYIKGLNWNMKEEQHLLFRMAVAGQIAVFALCLLVPRGLPLLFGLTLLIFDGLLFFYPFCGFNASRIKRMGTKTYALYLTITLAALAVLLVY